MAYFHFLNGRMTLVKDRSVASAAVYLRDEVEEKKRKSPSFFFCLCVSTRAQSPRERERPNARMDREREKFHAGGPFGVESYRNFPFPPCCGRNFISQILPLKRYFCRVFARHSAKYIISTYTLHREHTFHILRYIYMCVIIEHCALTGGKLGRDDCDKFPRREYRLSALSCLSERGRNLKHCQLQ